MKHPNREQWIAFLYEDCEPAEKSELTGHLESCAACREQLETWRATATALNEYKVVPASLSLRVRVRSWVPLAAGAAMFLAAGILIGAAWQSRASSGQSQLVADLRNRIEKSEAENVKTQKLLAELSQTIAANRAQDQAALLATAQQVKATRKDLETVATLTEAGLVRLASYNPQSE
jgi:hypothetical protein